MKQFMQPNLIGLMVYGDTRSGRDVLTEEKYRDLAAAFLSFGYGVRGIIYNDEWSEALYNELHEFDAILVWVNPIEGGKDRKILDSLLLRLAAGGCLVSTHPGVILKMWTKEILFKTKDMDWGGDTKLYSSYDDFLRRFPKSLDVSGTKILKQYRGNGGNGVFKIQKNTKGQDLVVIHAKDREEKSFSWSDFFKEFSPFFSNGGLMIEQEWNDNLVNGMVRCYVCGSKVAGFGYQEVNALYEINAGDDIISLPPAKRYYFTENCGLFSDLKEIMEASWVPQLAQRVSIENDSLPVIWDADFFINHINSPTPVGKYSLCEINVSSVSPFPPSAIKFMVEEVSERMQKADKRIGSF